MRRSRQYTLSAVLDGEPVEVVVSLGPPEPAGEPFAGCRDLEVLSVTAEDGEDLVDHAEELDVDALVDRAIALEEDYLLAALEDKADAAREERMLKDF